MHFPLTFSPSILKSLKLTHSKDCTLNCDVIRQIFLQLTVSSGNWPYSSFLWLDQGLMVAVLYQGYFLTRYILFIAVRMFWSQELALTQSQHDLIPMEIIWILPTSSIFLKSQWASFYCFFPFLIMHILVITGYISACSGLDILKEFILISNQLMCSL